MSITIKCSSENVFNTDLKRNITPTKNNKGLNAANTFITASESIFGYAIINDTSRKRKENANSHLLIIGGLIIFLVFAGIFAHILLKIKSKPTHGKTWIPKCGMCLKIVFIGNTWEYLTNKEIFEIILLPDESQRQSS